MTRQNKFFMYTLCGSLLFILDRLTKSFALVFFTTRHQINSWCACSLAFNRGMCNGLFYSKNMTTFWVITGITIAITLGVLVYAFDRFKKGFSIVGELFVLVGSLSNICDRFLYHGVIDFIELSYQGYLWPHFNGADMLIVCGVFIMFLTHRES